MPKNLSEWVKMIIQILATLIIGWVLLSATERGQKMLSTEKIINEKADIDYVDKQDAIIQNNLNNFKIEVDSDMDRIINNMNERFDSQDDKLNLVVDLLKE